MTAKVNEYEREVTDQIDKSLKRLKKTERLLILSKSITKELSKKLSQLVTFYTYQKGFHNELLLSTPDFKVPIDSIRLIFRNLLHYHSDEIDEYFKTSHLYNTARVIPNEQIT